MVQLRDLAWRLLVALSFLYVSNSSGDSVNVDLEIVENVDLSSLGEEGLVRNEGSYELTVDEQCTYLLKITFKENSNDEMKNDTSRYNFGGECDKEVGASLHEHNRNWLQFKNYVKETTGFDHMSLYPRPCGLEPLGKRQPRYDVNFYRAPAHYRAVWVCRTFDLPKRCEYNQPNFLGRGHFTVGRLKNDAFLVPNTPKNFQPDPNAPQAHAFEGLLMYDQQNIPQTVDDMDQPELEMSTYDGDFASWRAILPYKFVSGSTSDKSFSESVSYQYQTLPQLPNLWSVTYNATSKEIEVILQGRGTLCGDAFEQAKQVQEST
eukprot:scaffold10199_cov146-Cylindrotheca_fusiformis.AAC.38